MALSVDTIRETRGSKIESAVVTDALQVFAGGLMGLQLSSGLVVKWANTVGIVLKGIAMRGVTGSTVAPLPECEMDCSGLILARLSVAGVGAQTEVGDLVYATSDDTFTLTPTANVGPVGYVEKWHSGSTADVKLFSASEYRAWQAI